MNYSDYKHFIPIQIRFSDVDRLNHVNNACYLNYFELGRVKYFNEVFKDKINFILAENLDEVFAVAFDHNAKNQDGKKPIPVKKEAKKSKSLAA